MTGPVVRQKIFLAPEVLADPYPLYARLRSQDASADGRRGSHRLFRFDDVAAALRDERFSTAGVSASLDRARAVVLTPEAKARTDHAAGIRARMLLYQDPPHHTRLRRLVQTAFTPRAVERQSISVDGTVADLLGRARVARRLDVVGELGLPLAVATIADIVGFPRRVRPTISGWIDDIIFSVGTGRPDPVRLERAARAGEEFAKVVNAAVRERKGHPRDDLLTTLVEAETSGHLSRDELVATALSILIGGIETTACLIANGVLALVRHPAELAALQQTPALIETAVEEFIRYDSPIQVAPRLAIADLDLNGRQIRKGEIVECWLGAANRDPRQFPEPDRLDLRRTPNPHVGFGHGTHYCLGASLARLEAQTAIATLVHSFPSLRLAGDIAWRPSVVFRRPAALPIEW